MAKGIFHQNIAALLVLLVFTVPAVSAPNPVRGAQIFRACAACHSLAANRNMTGPSLAGIWGRRAGTLKSFERYSSAIKQSGIIWNDDTLDRWLTEPASFIADNYMTFVGIADARQRADLIAYLRDPKAGKTQMGGGQTGGMMGMGSAFADLKRVGPEKTVRSIRMCRDSYFVTTSDNKVRPFWEPNLRFETDSSSLGPIKGKPAILPAGMLGDRASVIFASPDEIGSFIKHQC